MKPRGLGWRRTRGVSHRGAKGPGSRFRTVKTRCSLCIRERPRVKVRALVWAYTQALAPSEQGIIRILGVTTPSRKRNTEIWRISAGDQMHPFHNPRLFVPHIDPKRCPATRLSARFERHGARRGRLIRSVGEIRPQGPARRAQHVSLPCSGA